MPLNGFVGYPVLNKFAESIRNGTLRDWNVSRSHEIKVVKDLLTISEFVASRCCQQDRARFLRFMKTEFQLVPDLGNTTNQHFATLFLKVHAV